MATNNQTIEMLVSFFNMKAKTRFRIRNERTQSSVQLALDSCNGDVGELKAFFRINIEQGETNLHKLCRQFAENHGRKIDTPPVVDVQPDEVKPVVDVEQVKPVEQPPVVNTQSAQNMQTALDLIGGVITQLLAQTKLDEIKGAVSESLKADVQKFIMDNYGPIKRKIEFELPEKKVQLEGVLHEQFETVLKFVQADEPVFLTGPAGSGKNVLCQQIAKAMGLKFYFSNAVTQEYKLTGFTDAMGTFHESQFYKAFKDGGVFMLDEMDASIPEVLIILNAAIANRYFDFPAPIGYVEAHPDFRVIAAGNTFGNGADYDYVGRNQLDAASLDRFALVRIDYSAEIEKACANGDDELLAFCRKFRSATKKAGIRTVVSYRAISRMAKLSKMMDKAQLLDSCLIKSLDLDDLKAIKNDLNGCGSYTAAFLKVMEDRERG